MELIDRLLGRDDETDGESAATADEEMLFEEDGGGDDLGGFDDGEDDLGGFGDDLGAVDGDGGGTSTAELEGRIDELENEVGSLSSTVSTIRSENEEISTTVEDVEENVRKLLDIYEMVTRGVNPFVDDVQATDGMGGGGDGGSLGLFDDDASEDDGSEDLDDDIADAEAEDFFDDDFLDDDETGEPDGFDQGTDHVTTTEDSMGDDHEESDDSGKSFDELKDEYESGDAEWADGDDGDATNGDGGAAFEEVEADADPTDEPAGGPEPDFGGPTDGDRTADADEQLAAAQATGGGPDPTADREADAGSAGDLQFAANTLMNDTGGAPVTKPYLEVLPSGYVGDLLVMEWLEYLVEESDVDDAARAVEYYRRIQWVGEDAADQLHEFLDGFGDLHDDVSAAPTALSIDHHVASLRYISRLTGSTADSIVFDSWSGGGGVPFGL